jgi:hypothetical protein
VMATIKTTMAKQPSGTNTPGSIAVSPFSKTVASDE